VVNIFTRPDPYIVELITHELGHRYWFKFMQRGQRGKFESLVRAKPSREESAPSPLVDVRKLVSECRSHFLGLVRAAQQDVDWEQIPRKELAKKYAGAFASFATEELAGVLQALRAGKTYRRCEALAEDFGKFVQDGMAARLFAANPEKWLAKAGALFDRVGKAIEALAQEVSRLPKADPEDTRPVPAVSDYGRSNIDEAFAEVFMRFVLERELTRDQLESFRSVLATASPLVPKAW
jgi:hypothetical protein